MGSEGQMDSVPYSDVKMIEELQPLQEMIQSKKAIANVLTWMEPSLKTPQWKWILFALLK